MELAMLKAAWIEAAARFGAPPASAMIRPCSVGSPASEQSGNRKIAAGGDPVVVGGQERDRDRDLRAERAQQRARRPAVRERRADQVADRHAEAEEGEQPGHAG